MPAFSYRTECTLVLKPGKSALSLAAPTGSQKPLLEPHPVLSGRLTPQELYDRLPRKPQPPFLVAGVRNVLSNLRCIAYGREMSDMLQRRVARLTEEHEAPGRPYHAILCRDAGLAIAEFAPNRPLSAPQPDLDQFDWMVTGTPVCWDDEGDELFERMISDAADHSHVWHLPRGAHPGATPGSLADWSRLHAVFEETLTADRRTAAAGLRSLAENLKLKREADYLHSVWGVRDDGTLVIHIAHQMLEDLGARLQALGCRRGICVENGGSVALYLVTDPGRRPWIPLISAPNLRPAGTAFVFFELPDGRYDVLPGNDRCHSTISSQ